MNKYVVPATAQGYIKWLGSEDGQTQKEILGSAIKTTLPAGNQTVLDAACGSGWFTASLSQLGHNTQGCDESEALIKYAQSTYPHISFKQCSLEEPLPYPDGHFDTTILNMAIQDLNDPQKALSNLTKVIKPGGALIITIPNPAYAYPVGVWKRGIIGRLLDRKPTLKLRPEPTEEYKMNKSKLSWSNYWRPFKFYTNALPNVGFKILETRELKSDRDSDHFSLRYQLYRYPLFLLLKCVKLGQ